MHLKVKLDTNGTNPELLQKILDQHLIDYVAMDLKNSWKKYEITSGVKCQKEKIKKSIDLIEHNEIPYEFRMTINKTMHKIEDIEEARSYLKDPSRFFLQPYKHQPTQLEKVNFGEWTPEEIKKLEESFLVKN